MTFGVSTVVHDQNKGGMHWREKQKYKDAGKPLPKPVPKKEHREVCVIVKVFCAVCVHVQILTRFFSTPEK